MAVNEMIAGTASNVLALTEGQKEIWIAQQMIDDSARYNTAECIRISGEMSPEHFHQAVAQVVQHIEVLNCHYQLRDGQLVQVLDAPGVVNHQYLDLRHEADADAHAWQWMRNDVVQPVDLTQGALYGSCLMRVADDRFYWYQRVHHIALDGYGVALLLRQIAKTYTQRMKGQAQGNPRFTPLNVLLAEEEHYRHSATCERDRAFWHDYCRRLPPAPRLSPVRAEVSDDVQRTLLTLDASRFRQMKALAAAAGLSWMDLWLAVFSGYVAWKTQHQQIVLGMPFMNRHNGQHFTLPAMLVNILPLTISVTPQATLAQLAAHVRQDVDALKPHTRYRGMQLLRLRDDDEPLFGPVVNIMPFYEALDFNGVPASIDNVHGGPVDDCALRIVPTGNDEQSALCIHLDANPHIYSASALTAIGDGMMNWATYWLDHPEQTYAQLCQRQWSALEDAVIASRDTFSCQTQDVITRLRAQAARTPQAIALQSDDVQLRYAGLIDAVSAVSGALMTHGIQPGEVVAVYMPRSIATLQVMLGIIAAGATCFVLDTDSPDERLQQALAACQARCVVVDERLRDQRVFMLETLAPTALLAGKARPALPAVPLTPEMTAFLIFTSGSTGVPKGVAIPHRALGWFVDAAGGAYAVQPTDRMLQFSALTFDACLEEIFIPLCCGARVVLRTDAMAESLEAFLDYVTTHGITVLDLPTTFWHTLTLTLSRQAMPWPSAVHTLIVGGEAISQERLAQWKTLMGERVRLINTYGPTEGTIIFTYKVLAGQGFDANTQDLRSIGFPLAGLRCLILDRAQRPVAQGDEGELYLIGPTVSSGYINSEAMTRDSFVPMTLAGDTVCAYKTGDGVLQTAQGEIVYLGRIDKQVKFRGYRVDLNEIRDCCLAVPGVKEARAVMQRDGTAQLILYVQGERQDTALTARIDDHLRRTLPAYMQPNQILSIAAFPLTRSGKIDEKRLPKPDTLAAETQHDLPQTDFERQVAAVWQEELGLAQVGIHQDFYALGGSSLNLFSIHARLMQRGIAVSPKLLLENRTIHQWHQAWLHQSATACARDSGETCLIRLQQQPRAQRLWAFHPYTGRVECYRELAEHVGPMFEVIAVQAPYLSDVSEQYRTLTDLVRHYVHLVRQTQPSGPYYLLGYSLGGNIAYQVAQHLHDAGLEVRYLGLLDCRPPQCVARLDNPLHTLVRDKLGETVLESLKNLDEATQIAQIAERLIGTGHLRLMTKAQLIPALRFSLMSGQQDAAQLASLTLAGQVYHYGASAPGEEWQTLVTTRLTLRHYAGDHDSFMDCARASGVLIHIEQDLRLAIEAVPVNG